MINVGNAEGLGTHALEGRRLIKRLAHPNTCEVLWSDAAGRLVALLTPPTSLLRLVTFVLWRTATQQRRLQQHRARA